MVDPARPVPFGPTGPGPIEEYLPGKQSPIKPTVPGGDSFLEMFQKSINEVNNIQHGAADKVNKLVTGEITDLHEVMVATEEASIALNFLMQIRTQLLRGWNEIKRTPV